MRQSAVCQYLGWCEHSVLLMSAEEEKGAEDGPSLSHNLIFVCYLCECVHVSVWTECAWNLIYGWQKNICFILIACPIYLAPCSEPQCESSFPLYVTEIFKPFLAGKLHYPKLLKGRFWNAAYLNNSVWLPPVTHISLVMSYTYFKILRCGQRVCPKLEFDRRLHARQAGSKVKQKRLQYDLWVCKRYQETGHCFEVRKIQMW